MAKAKGKVTQDNIKAILDPILNKYKKEMNESLFSTIKSYFIDPVYQINAENRENKISDDELINHTDNYIKQDDCINSPEE